MYGNITRLKEKEAVATLLFNFIIIGHSRIRIKGCGEAWLSGHQAPRSVHAKKTSHRPFTA